MFIRSLSNGGGYQGDVNTAFRQGRQDAFRDYIDNFNFALKADASNNAENQNNVQRIANNYGLQLGMNDKARKDAIDFIKTSGEIPLAQTQAQVNFNTGELLQDKISAMALSKASTISAKQDAAAYEAMYNVKKNQGLLENAPYETEKNRTGFQADTGTNQNTISENERIQSVEGSYGTAEDFIKNTDKWKVDHLKKTAAEMVKQYPEMSLEQAVSALSKDQTYLTQRDNDYQKAYNYIVNQRAAKLGKEVNFATGTVEQTEKGSKSTTKSASKNEGYQKPSAPKSIKANEGGSYVVGDPIGYFNGMPAYRTADNGVFIGTTKGGGTYYGPMFTKGNSAVSAEDMLRLRAITLSKAPTSGGVTTTGYGN